VSAANVTPVAVVCAGPPAFCKREFRKELSGKKEEREKVIQRKREREREREREKRDQRDRDRERERERGRERKREGKTYKGVVNAFCRGKVRRSTEDHSHTQSHTHLKT
jgi:hypothetical protein